MARAGPTIDTPHCNHEVPFPFCSCDVHSHATFINYHAHDEENLVLGFVHKSLVEISQLKLRIAELLFERSNLRTEIDTLKVALSAFKPDSTPSDDDGTTADGDADGRSAFMSSRSSAHGDDLSTGAPQVDKPIELDDEDTEDDTRADAPADARAAARVLTLEYAHAHGFTLDERGYPKRKKGALSSANLAAFTRACEECNKRQKMY